MMLVLNIDFFPVVVIVVYWSTLALCEADCPADGYCAAYGSHTTIPGDIPSTVSQIHLQDNQISSIKPGAFINNIKCTTLRLEFNKLTTISGNMWQGLQTLKYLYLGGNNIETVGERGFSNLPILEGLYLENNKLIALSEDIFNLNHPSRIELMLFGNQFNKGDQGLCWIQRGKTDGWIIRSSRLTTIIESLECTQTAKPEIQSSTGSTNRTDGVPESRSRKPTTEEVTVTETVTEESSRHHPFSEPPMQPLQPETIKTAAQLETTHWVFVIGGVAVCFITVTTITTCFLCRSKLPQLCKKMQQTSVVEIELQPLPIEDRPAPDLPPNRVTIQSSTTHPPPTQSSTARSSHSTTQPSTTHPSTSHFTSARDSQGYLLPSNEQADSRAESGSPETSRCSGIYSYAYQHMVARIMAFRMLQRRCRLGATSAQVHRQNRRQHPPARRPSSDPTSLFWNTQDSSGSTQDSSSSTRLPQPGVRREFVEMSSSVDSDYLEPLPIDDTQPGTVYERIDDSEIVMMVTNV